MAAEQLNRREFIKRVVMIAGGAAATAFVAQTGLSEILADPMHPPTEEELQQGATWCTAAKDCPPTWYVGTDPACQSQRLYSCTKEPDKYTIDRSQAKDLSIQPEDENPGDFEYIAKVMGGAPVIRVEGTKNSKSPKFIDGLVHLRAFHDKWNGYKAKSPFGDSDYPLSGNWGAAFRLFTDQTTYKEVWFWTPDDSTKRLLTFAFYDLKFTDQEHPGQHNFEWARVDRNNLNRVLRIR